MHILFEKLWKGLILCYVDITDFEVCRQNLYAQHTKNYPNFTRIFSYELFFQAGQNFELQIKYRTKGHALFYLLHLLYRESIIKVNELKRINKT